MLDENFIKITFDKSVQKTVSLKELCLKAATDINLEVLNLKIELGADVKICLHDDLVELADLANLRKIEHSIEFTLNGGSRLEYRMNLRPELDFTSSDQGGSCTLDKTLKLNFIGEHALAKVRATCLGTAQQKFNFITEQNHFASQSSSCLCVKSALLDSACLTCKSKIFVNQGLLEVFARQINKNLLLSSDASVLSIPQLEVLSDNVKCKHGAMVKALTDEHLFYMQSRGIPQSHAERLLISGFLF